MLRSGRSPSWLDVACSDSSAASRKTPLCRHLRLAIGDAQGLVFGNEPNRERRMFDERTILARITALGDLDSEGLRQEWRALFTNEPPNYGQTMMRKRLAYRIQELAYGGLPTAARERLRAIHAQARSARCGAKLATDLPVSGTVLIREHEGVRHEVRIVSGGFEYAGKTWKSLSMIAREITGVRWNGPAFFGLRSKRNNRKHKGAK
jgi:hypothetical protein